MSESPVTIKPLRDVVGTDFAAAIKIAVPSFTSENKFYIPRLFVVIGESREMRRDFTLSLLQEYLGDIYGARCVVISDHPEEIPARPPKKDATMEEYTYNPALFSVSPEKTTLPDTEFLDSLRGPQPSTTKLAKVIVDFSRWDTDIYAVLSPLEIFSWQALVQVTLTSSISLAGVERKRGEAVSIGAESIRALEMLGAHDEKGNVIFIDLDEKKIHHTLGGANITAY